jgi:hypothetical protein
MVDQPTSVRHQSQLHPEHLEDYWRTRQRQIEKKLPKVLAGEKDQILLVR